MNVERLLRILLLSDYNTRVVVFGTVALGIAGGVIGVFLLLRRRALLADAVSHAALPGVAIAFLVLVGLGQSGRNLPVLMIGALVSGLIGMGCVIVVNRYTRLSEDAALGIVLSVFFGFGVALLGIIQKMRGAAAAGLDSFIYGKTASMIRSDALLIGVVAVVVLIGTTLLFKELRLITFDPDFAAGDGWPVGTLDVTLMALVVIVTVIGLQSVGIILVIALLIIPPAAARFWTESLRLMAVISGLIGALGGYLGTAISGMAPRLPAGAVIVTVMGAAFTVSFLVGSERGLVRVLVDNLALRQRVLNQNLLRALYECEETGCTDSADGQMHYLSTARGWSAPQLRRWIRRATRQGMLTLGKNGCWDFTDHGRREATRVTRNHRLWEIYLLEHADVAPAHVDQGADFIEHVLGDTLVAELEDVLADRDALPASPHSLLPASEARTS
ncbi:MAG: iron ABC transporter [Spirochaetaceae bacterium]|nr:MAG: iron ABC transporter [Spirochaetaceae bacterium]